MQNLLLSTVTLLVVPAVALAAPDFSSQSHTHTTPIELEPISSSSGLKLASVCFLGYGDCGDGGFDSIAGDDGYTVDTIKQCKNEGFVNSCSSGYCMDGSCPYDANYGKCIEENCPTNSSPSCNGEVIGQNACGGDCKKCCDDICPSGSKTYTGSYASTTECGNKCYNCSTDCPDGSKTSYTGTSAGTNECGQACKKCNTSCPAGYTATATSECYDTVTNECGSTCYKAKDCDPCPGYYDCGGAWQYCEGSVCSADSSRCSTFCEDDHFPYSCGSDYGPCNGDYRNGYCSVPCEKNDPCANVTCSGPNEKCVDGECRCVGDVAGTGYDINGVCREPFGSGWKCCTVNIEDVWYDDLSDDAAKCLSDDSWEAADSFASECEALGGQVSGPGTSQWNSQDFGVYRICSYLCEFW